MMFANWIVDAWIWTDFIWKNQVKMMRFFCFFFSFRFDSRFQICDVWKIFRELLRSSSSLFLSLSILFFKKEERIKVSINFYFQTRKVCSCRSTVITMQNIKFVYFLLSRRLNKLNVHNYVNITSSFHRIYLLIKQPPLFFVNLKFRVELKKCYFFLIIRFKKPRPASKHHRSSSLQIRNIIYEAKVHYIQHVISISKIIQIQISWRKICHLN